MRASSLTCVAASNRSGTTWSLPPFAILRSVWRTRASGAAVAFAKSRTQGGSNPAAVNAGASFGGELCLLDGHRHAVPGQVQPRSAAQQLSGLDRCRDARAPRRVGQRRRDESTQPRWLDTCVVDRLRVVGLQRRDRTFAEGPPMHARYGPRAIDRIDHAGVRRYRQRVRGQAEQPLEFDDSHAVRGGIE